MRRWLVLIPPLLVSGCQTVGEITGRGIPELERRGGITREQGESLERVVTAARRSYQDLSDREEYYIGRAVAAHILEKHRVSEDEILTRYVCKVGNTVAWASDRPETYGGYHFLVLDTEEPLAYAAPGGFIFVSSGLLGMMKNEEELAGVLAHEVAHVSEKHGLSAIKQSRLISAFSILVGESKKYTSDEVRRLVDAYEGTLDDIVQTLVEKGYSRSQEHEADRLGSLFAYRAGYDPQGLVSFLRTLGKQYGEELEIGLLKTHPKPEERFASLKKHVQEEGLTGKTEPARTSRFTSYRRRVD